MQIRQAAGYRVSESAAADPIVGLDTQVATQRTLRRTIPLQNEVSRLHKLLYYT